MQEQWVVKNNTRGPVFLPKNKIHFNHPDQEKELCFTTNKTVEELERDPEINFNIEKGFIITVSKISEKQQEKIENRKVVSDLSQQIDELKALLIASQQQNQNNQPEPKELDTDKIIEAIKDNIQINVKSSGKSEENIVSSEEEKMKEDALKELIFRKDKSTKSFDNLGSSKEVKIEGEGNEDLLDDLNI